MNIVIIGTGYVGLVSGVCFSELGHNVTCVDVDKTKIEKLSQGIPTIHEQGLELSLNRNISEGRLSFTTDLSSVIDTAGLVFIAVGTPEKDNGETDLSYILGVARGIAEAATADVFVVLKSTAPVGTIPQIEDVFYKTLSELNKENIKIYCSSNPEFLREGTAISDFMNPDRIVIGTNDDVSKYRLQTVYSKFEDRGVKILYTSVESAQLIKYASNAFNACKISFINSLADYCSIVGANIEDVALGMGLDKRIGTAFLKAGIGYGGSCFPKDIASLKYEISKATAGHENAVLRGIEEENTNARWWMSRTLHHLSLEGLIPKECTIAVLGLAFKPGTDDVRYAPALDFIEEESCFYKIKAYDPIATHNAEVALNSEKYDDTAFENVKFCDTIQEAITDADVVVFCTEWPEFKKFSDLDIMKMKTLMSGNTILDGRNIFNPEKMSKVFNYYCVGKKHI